MEDQNKNRKKPDPYKELAEEASKKPLWVLVLILGLAMLFIFGPVIMRLAAGNIKAYRELAGAIRGGT